MESKNISDKKSVLILGAGLMQIPAVQAAKDLGFFVYLIDANSKAPAVGLADCFNAIDLKDRKAIAEYALSLKKNAGLQAVFTAGTDFSTSVSYAAQSCGLMSHTFEAAVNASNKAVMRKCFSEHNVPSPSFIQIPKDSIGELTFSDNIPSVKYPCVVKPVDNMGARGCRMIRTKDELIQSVQEACSFSRTENAILEEYMEGPEYSIDALVYDGTMTITGFADRHIYFPPYFIETGHTMPTTAPVNVKNELIRTFARGVAALGLTHGAAKADIKYTKNGPMIGEIAGRLSGGYMSGWTYPYSSGLNLTKEALKIAAGIVPDELEAKRIPLDISSVFTLYEVPSSSVCAERAWISIPGIIKKIHGLENVKAIEGVRDVFPRNKSGDTVTFPRNNVEKCGNVICHDKDYDKAVKSARKAVASIVLELEKDCEATTDFLEGKRTDCEKDFAPNAFDFNCNEQAEIFKELDKLTGNLCDDLSIIESVPEVLRPYMNREDFNHRTLEETLRLFEKMSDSKKLISCRKFWKYVIRGGIQGALYA